MRIGTTMRYVSPSSTFIEDAYRRAVSAALADLEAVARRLPRRRGADYRCEQRALAVTVPDGVEATARDGNIQLAGTVSFGYQRDAAELAVAGLTGVRNLRDDIDITGEADPVDVTMQVPDALNRYSLVPDDSDVAVDAKGHGDAHRPPRPAAHSSASAGSWMARVAVLECCTGIKKGRSAMPKYLHGDPRVHVQRHQERGTSATCASHSSTNEGR